jgi:hypothetical protein
VLHLILVPEIEVPDWEYELKVSLPRLDSTPLGPDVPTPAGRAICGIDVGGDFEQVLHPWSKVLFEDVGEFKKVDMDVRICTMCGQFDKVTPVAKGITLAELQPAAKEGSGLGHVPSLCS